MGLRDELPDVSPRGTRCLVGELLTTLDKKTADELRELVDDPKVRSSQLAALAKAKGWPVKDHSWARHRRKECQCR